MHNTTAVLRNDRRLERQRLRKVMQSTKNVALARSTKTQHQHTLCRFTENAAGRCTMGGGCATAATTALCPATLARAPVQTCADVKCNKACVVGTAASVYASVAAVCHVNARGACDTGFSCDTSGNCVMDPTMVTCVRARRSLPAILLLTRLL
jgi:hypothetical protein